MLIYWRVYEIIQIFLVDDFFGMILYLYKYIYIYVGEYPNHSRGILIKQPVGTTQGFEEYQVVTAAASDDLPLLIDD